MLVPAFFADVLDLWILLEIAVWILAVAATVTETSLVYQPAAFAGGTVAVLTGAVRLWAVPTLPKLPRLMR